MRMRTILLFSTALALLLSACTMPAVPPPATATSSEGPSYTAAAQTIEAQLTEIALPFVEPSQTPTPTEPVTETLPPTSTPLPTRTPLPSDTLQPSNTPKPSATLAPSSTAIVTTPVNTPLPILANKPAWEDTFKDGSNWPLYNDENIQMQITAGGLALTALNANRRDPYDGWMITNQNLKDFYLEATTKFGECSSLDRYGLLFRATADGGSGYMAGISCDGKYSLRLWDNEAKKLYMLIPWTPSEKIKQGPGQTNTLGIKAEGDQIGVYVNGEFLNGVQDKTFSAGAFGPFAGAYMTNGFTALFQRIAYWTLGE
jgi:hypothetical protein